MRARLAARELAASVERGPAECAFCYEDVAYCLIALRVQGLPLYDHHRGPALLRGQRQPEAEDCGCQESSLNFRPGILHVVAETSLARPCLAASMQRVSRRWSASCMANAGMPARLARRSR